MADRFKTCSVIGCNRSAHYSVGGCKGFCRPHYRRYYAYGHPLSGPRPFKGDPQKFLNELLNSPQSESCVKWPFSRKTNGYAQINIDGKNVVVSRLVCAAVNGEPPFEGAEAAHTCGNGHLGCVNPDHLAWKSHSENMADKIVHGTHNRGENHASSKLTKTDVTAIRKLDGAISQSMIAKRFGVCRTHVGRILRRTRWDWLD